jgi:hypothetical protein
MSGWLADLWNDGIADWSLASNLIAELAGLAVSVIVVYLIIERLLDRREQRAWETARSQVVERLGTRLFDWLVSLRHLVTGEAAFPPEYVAEPRLFDACLDRASGEPEVLCDDRLLYKKLDLLVQESLNLLARSSPVLKREPALVTLLQQLENSLWRWNTFFLYRDAGLMRPTDQWQLEAVKGSVQCVKKLVAHLWPHVTLPELPQKGTAR